MPKLILMIFMLSYGIGFMTMPADNLHAQDIQSAEYKNITKKDHSKKHKNFRSLHKKGKSCLLYDFTQEKKYQ